MKLVLTVLGVVLLTAAGTRTGSKRGSNDRDCDHDGAARRGDPDVAPGDEPGASPDPERPPPRRPPGFIWGERSWTWREIDAQVSALAAALAARGIVKGDRILVHSKNCDEMFWSMFAAFRLGAVWVPTNFRLLPDEVAYLATASGAKAFLCHGDFPEHAAPQGRQAPRSNSPGGSARGPSASNGRRRDRGTCRREGRECRGRI